MALEATHIRFALDLQQKYQVRNLQKYISGTIYPDSRYVTRLDRTFTHPQNYMDWDLTQVDDFQKGWYAHLLCDKIQRLVMKEMIPTAFEGTTGQGSEVWIKHTALKILQDMDDVHQFDIKAALPNLEYIENPNKERVDLLIRYNQIFIRLYTEPHLNLDRYILMWKEMGLGDDIAIKVKEQVLEYQADKGIMDSLKKVYSRM